MINNSGICSNYNCTAFDVGRACNRTRSHGANTEVCTKKTKGIYKHLDNNFYYFFLIHATNVSKKK